MLVLVLAVILDLRAGWSYALAPSGNPPPADERAWVEDITPRLDRDRWYRVPLPAALPRDARIVFRSYVPAFELRIEERQFYAFRDDAADGHLRLHDVPLPRDAAGKRLFVRIPAGSTEPLFGGAPLLAAPAAAPEALVRVTTVPLFDDLQEMIVCVECF